MRPPSAKLLHTLIGKSIVETLLVGGLAVFTFMNVFPPYFHGWGEIADNTVAGWAVNNAQPWERVEVHLFVDGKFSNATIANLSRTDVRDAGWAKDEWHGYVFAITNVSAGTHEARMYALHDSGSGTRKSLQLLGDPIVFVVDAQGNLSWQKK